MELVGDMIAGAARPVAARVAALNHKAVDDAVKDQSVIEAFLHEINKILCGNRRFIFK